MAQPSRDNKEISDDQFTNIWIDLPEEIFQETLTARRLENNLYQISQIPFYAENLNLFDIVECNDVDEVKHVFVRVVKFNGYQTIHIEFSDITDTEITKQYIRKLGIIGIEWVNSGKYFAISIPPDIESSKIFGLLREWEQQNILKIEAINICS